MRSKLILLSRDIRKKSFYLAFGVFQFDFRLSALIRPFLLARLQLTFRLFQLLLGRLEVVELLSNSIVAFTQRPRFFRNRGLTLEGCVLALAEILLHLLQ